LDAMPLFLQVDMLKNFDIHYTELFVYFAKFSISMQFITRVPFMFFITS
jgi:hypothetical protein